MPEPRVANERRQQPELRAIFPAACEALRPFFESTNRWEGQTHEHLAYRALKEQFPELTAQQSMIVVATAKRVFSSGRNPPVR